MSPLRSEDAKAIALLCTNFEKNASSLQSLSVREYNSLAQWLKDKGMTPKSLFCLNLNLAQKDGFPAELDAKRITDLLARGPQLAVSLEKLNSVGIQLCCRSDADYPRRYKKKLGDKAPPCFYYTGNLELADRGGLAVVGSRDLESSGEAFARNIGEECAAHGVTVISGGARGADTITMLSALEHGGSAIGVLCEKLRLKSVSKPFRAFLGDGRLLLLSPYPPDSHFAVWQAMARNKLIYTLSDFALVVSSGDKKGGTWDGATEELKRKNSVPVYVRDTEEAPAGNKRLLEEGARSWPGLDEALEQKIDSSPATQSGHPETGRPTEKEKNSPIVPPAPIKTSSETTVESHHPYASFYEYCIKYILEEMNSPTTSKDLAQKLEVKEPLIKEWLERAVRENKVCKLTKRPIRYIRDPQESLFKSPTSETILSSSIDYTSVSFYEYCLKYMLKEMNSPTTSKDLAQKLEVKEPLIKEWLERAVRENKVRKTSKRPIRYARIEEGKNSADS